MIALRILTGLLRWWRKRAKRKALVVLDRESWLADCDLDRYGLSRKDMDRLMDPPCALVRVTVERFLGGGSTVYYGLTDRGVHQARMLRESTKRGPGPKPS